MDYRALAATDVWEQETAETSGEPLEVLAAITDPPLLAEVRQAFESASEHFSIKQVSSFKQAKTYCQSNAVACVLLAEPLLREERKRIVADNIHELRIGSGSLSLPVLVLSDSSSVEVRSRLAQLQSCDTHELSETGVDGLFERVSRLMWRSEIEDALTDGHLRTELLSLPGAAYEEAFVARVESMVSALQKPLEAVQVFTSVALDESPLSEVDPQDNPLVLAKDSSETLEHQIDALQECIDNHRRRAAYPQNAVRLRDLFAVVLRVTDIEARQAGIDIEIINGPNLPAVQCNAVRVSQALVRILSFGFEFVGTGGKLRLETLAGETEGSQKVTVMLMPRSRAEPVLFDLVVRERFEKNPEYDNRASLAGDFDFAEGSSAEFESSKADDLEICIRRGSRGDSADVEDPQYARNKDVKTTKEGGCA